MRALTIALAMAAFGSVAGAQSSSQAFVRVTARDSSGAPVGAAELTLTRGLHDVVARGTTDEDGHALLSVDVKDSSDFQLTMRKVGYRRGDRFFEVGPRDTADLRITVPRPGNTLAAVTVTATRDNRYNSYDLSADEIEASTAYLDNAWEVVKKLRPVMLTSRGGCASGAREVWVNGKRIRLPLPATGLAAARARVGLPPGARFSYVPVAVLTEIAPEHIDEIRYHDCFDTSMAAVGNNDAIFVTLKPGVVYQENVGSFVLDSVPAKQKR
jgi:hypothetical protein